MLSLSTLQLGIHFFSLFPLFKLLIENAVDN